MDADAKQSAGGIAVHERIFKVGVSAVFDPKITPHARTFLRATSLARNFLPQLSGVEFVYQDDAASPAEAKVVANEFVKADVDVVIGHFSSDAALAAAPIYQDAKIPLLLPAATADAATERPGVYRLCPTDSALARFLVDAVLAENWNSIEVLSDESEHGKAIAQAVRREAHANGIALDRTHKTCATVFAGRLGASEAFLPQHFAMRPDTPLIFGDDVVSPRVAGYGALRAPVYAVGFPPPWSYPRATVISRQHELLFGNLPETYFLESYAAFEILSALVVSGASAGLSDFLEESSFETVFGPINFTHGNVEHLGHTLWVLEESGFTVSHNPRRISWVTDGPHRADSERNMK